MWKRRRLTPLQREVQVLSILHDAWRVRSSTSPGKRFRIQGMPICERHQIRTPIGRIIAQLLDGHNSPELITDQLPNRLVAWVREQDCLVGCMAWLTRNDVMAAIDQCRAVAIVVLKEEYLSRFASMPVSPEQQSIYRFYQATNPLSQVERYRAYGNLRERAQGRAIMHHKFLVGHTLCFNQGHLLPCPTSVWYGSWNATRGSSNNFDSATILYDRAFARQCLQEWWRIWALSDSLKAG